MSKASTNYSRCVNRNSGDIISEFAGLQIEENECKLMIEPFAGLGIKADRTKVRAHHIL